MGGGSALQAGQLVCRRFDPQLDRLLGTGETSRKNYVTIMVSMAFAVAFWIARTFLADVEPAQARRVEPCMMGEGR